MFYMEIALLNKSALRLKGKSTTFIVNPIDSAGANAAFLLDDSIEEVLSDETVVLQGPGDYEVGGVKIVGSRGESGFVYSMNMDGMDIIVGKLATLSAMQHKLKEHNIVIALCSDQLDSAFLTSLTTNVVIFYGEKAAESAQGFAKENVKQMNKYSVAIGKLPTEVETILLA